MKLIKRLKEPTPSFFQKIRNIGVALGSIGVAVLTIPVGLPELIVDAASYMAVGGTIAATVSQSATCNDDAALWQDEVMSSEKR